jgi:transposase
MARTAKFTKEELETARKIRDHPKDIREYRAALLVLLMAEHGLTRSQVARTFGIDVKTVFNDMKLVREHETAEPKNSWGGRRNCLMSLDDEKAFVRELLEQSKSGSVFTMRDLHAAYNRRVGKATPKSTVYRLLKRHNWPKEMADGVACQEDSSPQPPLTRQREEVLTKGPIRAHQSFIR